MSIAELARYIHIELTIIIAKAAVHMIGVYYINLTNPNIHLFFNAVPTTPIQARITIEIPNTNRTVPRKFKSY